MLLAKVLKMCLSNYEIKYEKSYVLVIRVSDIVRFDLNTDSYANFVKKTDTKVITFYFINSPSHREQ